MNAEEREEGLLIHSVLRRVECPRLSNGPLHEQDNSPQTGQAQGALERLTERDHVLPFAFDWRVPFDSDSEQAIRMAKIQQKAAWQHPVKRSCLVGQRTTRS